MNHRFAIRIITIIFILAAAGIAYVWACEGTPRPSCGQTIFLAKFPRRVVVHPGIVSTIAVPIGLIPFVAWNPNPLCAHPTAASLSLTLTCAPSGGGAPTIVGPVSVAVAVPTIPGPQAVSGGVFSFPIGAGVLPLGNYVCLVTGTYSVTFAGGLAAGTITGVGDTQVCIVEPSPADTSKPRLNMQHLQIGSSPFQVCRRGDQSMNFYLIENNDPANSVYLTLNSNSTQMSRLPATGDPNVIFAISSPTPGTDNYPQGFGDAVFPGRFIPEGDPAEVNNQLISRTLVLPPFGITTISVMARSHGMCIDGSCCENLVEVMGHFADNTPALGCAGTAYLVGTVAPKSPLCEFTDELQAGGASKATFATGVYTFGVKGVMNQETFGPGNLLQSEGGPGTQVAGPGAQLPLYSQQADDYFRAALAPKTVTYSVAGVSQQAGQSLQTNQINIKNLPATGSIFFPLIARNGAPGNFKVDKDAKTAKVKITDLDTNKIVFNGSFFDIFNANPDFIADASVTRQFSKTPIPTSPWLNLIPPAAGAAETSADFAATPMIFDPQGTVGNKISDVAWTASVDSTALDLPATSGAAGSFIQVNIIPANVADAPGTTIAHLTVASAESFNSPVVVPIALRKLASAASFPSANVTSLIIKESFDPKSVGKDTLTLKGAVDATNGMNPAGMTITIDVGGFVRAYTLDANGNSTPANKNDNISVKFKKTGGSVVAGPAPYTMTIKNATLRGFFADEGIQNETTPKGGKSVALNVNVTFNEIQQSASVVEIVTATADKSASTKLKKP